MKPLTQADAAGILLSHGATVSRIKEFLDWHKAHPEVWRLFRSCANELINRGESRISAKLVGELIRKRAGENPCTDFALNNNFLSYYVRLWIEENPIFKSKVELRRLAA